MRRIVLPTVTCSALQNLYTSHKQHDFQEGEREREREKKIAKYKTCVKNKTTNQMHTQV
jgi:hypothetical protein